MKTVKEILNFVRGNKEQKFHMVSYHVDKDTDKIIIDWCGSYADAKENSFMAWHGSVRFPEKNELETALELYLKTNKVEPYTIDMAYQRIRNEHNIK